MKKKLSDFPIQTHLIVSQIDLQLPEHVLGLHRHGIFVGAEIKVIKNSKSIPVMVESRGVCIVVDKEIAKFIDVELKKHE